MENKLGSYITNLMTTVIDTDLPKFVRTLAFEELKKTLRVKGFFDPIHKKAIPRFPRAIGLVTSGSGAAIKDILNILKRRAPHVEIIVRSASVQGKNSAEDISKAILDFNNYALVDVIVLGRGGGSIEDL